MITLIIEVMLTIEAWHKGWRGYALLPLEALFLCSFAVGMAISAAGGTIEQALPAGILLELACIGASIRLAVKGPRPALTPTSTASILGLGVPGDPAPRGSAQATQLGGWSRKCGGLYAGRGSHPSPLSVGDLKDYCGQRHGIRLGEHDGACVSLP